MHGQLKENLEISWIQNHSEISKLLKNYESTKILSDWINLIALTQIKNFQADST